MSLRSLREDRVKPEPSNKAATASRWPAPSSRQARPPGASRRGISGREAAIFGQAVGGGEQGLGRLPFGDVARQVGAALDIRRVAQDEVEPLVDPLPPVARAGSGARPDRPSRSALRAGVSERGFGRVDAEAGRLPATGRAPRAARCRGRCRGRGCASGRPRRNAPARLRSGFRCRAAGRGRRGRPPARSSRRRGGR